MKCGTMFKRAEQLGKLQRFEAVSRRLKAVCAAHGGIKSDGFNAKPPTLAKFQK